VIKPETYDIQPQGYCLRHTTESANPRSDELPDILTADSTTTTTIPAWFLWPMFSFQVYPGNLLNTYHWRAVDADHVVVWRGWYSIGRSIQRNRPPHGQQDRATTVEEDIHLVESVQRGLKSRGYVPGPLVVDPEMRGEFGAFDHAPLQRSGCERPPMADDDRSSLLAELYRRRVGRWRRGPDRRDRSPQPAKRSPNRRSPMRPMWTVRWPPPAPATSGALSRMRPVERGRMVQAMGVICSSIDEIAPVLTLEQGKPLWEAISRSRARRATSSITATRPAPSKAAPSRWARGISTSPSTSPSASRRRSSPGTIPGDDRAIAVGSAWPPAMPA
jgi:hypothetical protein